MSILAHMCILFLFFFNFYFILLCNTVLVLPYIDMNLPRVYTSSQSWIPLPPPTPYHHSGSSPCTSPKHPISCVFFIDFRVIRIQRYNTLLSIAHPLTLNLVPPIDVSIICLPIKLNNPEGSHVFTMGFPGGSDSKESSCSAGDLGSIPGSGRSPEERKGYPLQYSCLENSMYRGAQWATVHGIARSDQSHLTSIHSVCSPVWRKEGQPKV